MFFLYLVDNEALGAIVGTRVTQNVGLTTERENLSTLY